MTPIKYIIRAIIHSIFYGIDKNKMIFLAFIIIIVFPSLNQDITKQVGTKTETYDAPIIEERLEMNLFDENLLGIGNKKYSFHNVKYREFYKDTEADIKYFTKDVYTVKICEEKLDNCTELSSITGWNENYYTVIIGSEVKERVVPNYITKPGLEWQYENLTRFISKFQ